MNSFQCSTQSVLEYLTDHCCGNTLYSLYHSCFAQLGRHLAENGLNYSLENAQHWLKGQRKCKATMQAYEKAILRLDDIYRTSRICFANRLKGLSLPEAFDDTISSYLSDVSAAYSENHLPNILRRCRFFFSFLHQERKLDSPFKISYGDVLAFCRGPLTELCPADTCMYKGAIKNLLLWMAEHQMCTIGLSLPLHVNRTQKLIMLEDLPTEAVEAIRILQKDSHSDFPPDEFHSASLEFCNDLSRLGYAATMTCSARATLDLLYLFLDMNHLRYDPAIAWKWFETAGSCFGTNSLMSRRILALFEMYALEGAVCPERTFVYKSLLYDFLPEWCKGPLGRFLQQKRREHKAPSTVAMYRSANVRFCQFLNAEGLTAFDQVTADHLKKFNVSDQHQTVEGKNAYNVRIRKFLFYLAENNLVGNRFLGNALPCTSAPKTRIVQALSEEEILMLERYDEPDNPALGLRNRAMVLIGLRMGLRASDITSLELTQIDWRNRSIRFLQDKTDVEKVLPMPTAVGNALYLYLSGGRPVSNSRHVFISHKAPYRKIGRHVCGGIMKRALPDTSYKRAGFHITRKTYATQRFRNKCDISTVADLLGHTTTSTVHKYISLDEERMGLCPISLEVAGIAFKGGFQHE